VWVSDIRHYDAMNAAWDAWLDKANAPARATVESRLAATGYLVEIAVVAGA
jgi:enamine deaminase RidA (YjgF/YER057c/UK114 family)